jgi:hypothetical protein
MDKKIKVREKWKTGKMGGGEGTWIGREQRSVSVAPTSSSEVKGSVKRLLWFMRSSFYFKHRLQ